MVLPRPALAATAAGIALFLILLCPFSAAISSTEMAENHGLTISDFDGMIASELPITYSADGAGPGKNDSINTAGDAVQSATSAVDEDAENLFDIATARKWTFNKNVDASTSGVASPTHLYPYVACSSDPFLSGYKRIQAMDSLLSTASTPPLGSGETYFIGTTIVNELKARTCIFVSSHVDPYKTIIDNELVAADDNILDYFEYQPLMFAMKIVAGTTDELLRRMEQPDPDQDAMSIIISTCPVYSNYAKLGLRTRAQMGQDMLDFLVGSDSIDSVQSLYNSSFYVEAEQDASIDSTVRMDWWAGIINTVTEATDPTTGTNVCFDAVISQRLQLEQGYRNRLRVFVEHDVDANDVRMTKEEFQDCLMYVVAGLALHPYVCQMEPEFFSVPFPETSPAPTIAAPTADFDWFEDFDALSETSSAPTWKLLNLYYVCFHVLTMVAMVKLLL